MGRTRMLRASSLVRGWNFTQSSGGGPLCFVGDLHGCSAHLDRLWSKLPAAMGGAEAFDRAQVVFLGDYCDKGPDTRGVVDRLLALRDAHPGQRHHHLSGNHDFALSAFLGLLPGAGPGVDLSETWRSQYESRVPEEALYDGPGHDTMHLQGVRYAARGRSVFDSAATFASYGAAYGDRAGLLAAMPEAHQRFFAELQWIAKIRSSIGDVVAVHAGLEDTSAAELDDTVRALLARDPALLRLPFLEPLCGRAGVERMPSALLGPVLQKRGYLPPPLFLISGHHGFLRVNGRRIVVDMCSGRPEERDLAAAVLMRSGAPGDGSAHTQVSNDQGLEVSIVTSR